MIPTEFIPADFSFNVFSCCSRAHHSNQPDHKASELEDLTHCVCYLGCLTKRQLIMMCVCVGLFILLLVSAVTAVIITKNSGTCSKNNQIQSFQKKKQGIVNHK